jgi:hypothetical protein
LEEVCDPVQAVPGELTVQVYFRASVPVGGDPTEGPPAGAKSVVTSNWILPPPVLGVVRM